MGFGGFPRRVRHTPVPNPMFGTLLEEIDDLGELKATLRVMWLLQQKRGFPRVATLTELAADPIFQPFQGSRDGGLGQAEALSGIGHRARLGQDDEGAQQIPVELTGDAVGIVGRSRVRNTV